MSFALDMQKVATDLLTQFDERTVKAKLVTLGAKTWVDGEYVFAPSTEQELTGVAKDYNNALINGTTIQSGDILFIATSAVKPTQADKVVMDGSQYSIVSISPSAFTGADVTFLYKIQLRK